MSDFLLFTKKFLAEKYDVNSSSFKTSYSITKSFINRHLDLFEPKSVALLSGLGSGLYSNSGAI